MIGEAEEGEEFLSPQNVEPDTPQATVDAWNTPGKVQFLVVTKDGTCNARWNSEGAVDFFACGLNNND